MVAADRVILFVNPKAGSGAGRSAIDHLAEELRLLNLEPVRLMEIGRLVELTERESIKAVVSAGGDGTAELVASRLPPHLPLGILPLGTENLLARYLGIRLDPPRLAAMVAQGTTRPIDVGLANETMFLLMLSCGFDADVVRRLHNSRTGNITHLSYALPMVQSMLGYDFPAITIAYELEDGTWDQYESNWAFVFNAPVYAGGLKIVSQADPADGKLDVATFTGGSVWHGLKDFAAVVLEQHEGMNDFRKLRVKRLRLDSNRSDVPYKVDGDPAGHLPVDIEVLQHRLSILVES
jgi:diacylglycerol kinase family enzyme